MANHELEESDDKRLINCGNGVYFNTTSQELFHLPTIIQWLSSYLAYHSKAPEMFPKPTEICRNQQDVQAYFQLTLKSQTSRNEAHVTSTEEILDHTALDHPIKEDVARMVDLANTNNEQIPDNQSHSSILNKILSDDKEQYIEWEVTDNGFVQIKSCQFRYNDDSRSDTTVYIRKQKFNYLLTIDEQKFVARVEIDAFNGSEFTPAKTFKCKQKIIQNYLKVITIVEDEATIERNNACDELINYLERISKATAENREFAEDFFQFRLFEKESENLINFLSNHIIDNAYTSDQFKSTARKFVNSQKALFSRNKICRSFDDSIEVTLLRQFNRIYNEGSKQHRLALLNNFNLTHEMKENLNNLTVTQILHFSVDDVKLFSELITITGRHEHSIINTCALEFLKCMWNNVIRKVFFQYFSKMKSLRPLTNPPFLYFYKSFLDLLENISSRTHISIENLVKIEGSGRIKLINAIDWPTKSALTHSLEKQFYFVVQILNHFAPGNYCKDKDFQHKLQNDSTLLSGLSEERKIWYYFLHDTLMEIAVYQREQKQLPLNFQPFLDDLLRGYKNIISKSKNDLFETFRVSAHNIARLAAQMCPYFSTTNSKFERFDQSILHKQIHFIKIFAGQYDIWELDSSKLKEFANLLDNFSEYWESRESIITKIPEKCSCINFESDLIEMCESLLTIVDNVLKKPLTIESLNNYFRSFNEFLKHVKSLEFQWFVNENNSTIDSEMFDALKLLGVVSAVNDEKKSYRVLNSNLFIEIITLRGVTNIPKHYALEVVKCLLDIVNQFSKRQYWSADIHLNATSDLILAVGHSFNYLEYQKDYLDFSKFFDDSTKPFSCIVDNCATYHDFKRCLDNIEKFCGHSRKQNEIDLEKALDLYEQEVMGLTDCGFNTKFNRFILESCYENYSKQFNMHMETGDIKEIIADIREHIIENISSTTANVTEWTPHFKQNTIPTILAGVAAVWSILASKDVASIKQSIKPHCIQILCILRLLSVDNVSDGVHNHLAQVLTGQGKSIVLGLLSSLLALMGHKVKVVCYSNYLADRDRKAFREFFKCFESSEVSHGVKYLSFGALATEWYFGEKEHVRTVVESLVLNKLSKQIYKSPKITQKTFLLIDEIDVFFTDEASHLDNFKIKMPLFADIQIKIWQIVTGGIHDKDAVIRQIKEFIRTMCQNQNQNVDEFVKFMTTTELFFERNLQIMVADAIDVQEGNGRNAEYVIYNNGCIGRRYLLDRMIYGYYNVFNYFRLKKIGFDCKNYHNFGYITVDLGQICYSKLPMEYSVILGLSGTLTNFNNPEKEAVKSYNIQAITSVPSLFGCNKLIFDQNQHFNIQDMADPWLNMIFDHVNFTIQSGRSVLVCFEDQWILKLFEEKFQSNINRLNIIPAYLYEVAPLEWYITESGVAQTVTLITRDMGLGRGVDYKSNDSSVEHKGGLHVIQTFFSLDVKEEVQIKGRTARNGKNGSYELILYREDLKAIKCSVKDDGNPVNTYEDLNAIRKAKSEAQGFEKQKNVRYAAEEEHKKTMDFIKSLSEYSPDNRDDILSKFPFT